MADASADGRDRVELTVGGRVYGGWTSVNIQRGIDVLASSFALTLTERWPGQEARQEIKAGDAATVSIGGETVVTGYLDSVDITLAGDAHRIEVSGRSKAGDLIDCSAIAKPGQWTGRSLEAIAAELAKPFGVNVTAKASTAPPFKKFSIQQGESVFDAIERMCRMRGLLAISDAAGDVIISTATAGGSAVRIAQGKHILRIAARHATEDRFSKYVVKGQSAGDDEHNGRAVASPSAEASDPGIKRYRPLLVIAEDQAEIASLRTRAKWEATVRSAKAQSVEIDLSGWRDPSGALWRPMARVALDAVSAWISETLLVAAVAHVIDESGTRTTLTLARPEAYSQMAVPDAAEAGRIRKSTP